ncbi:hypothetical protein [Arthrobacter castelli]|uniref:hypothetical protein n=1 Tax=Arthrobacter castelli TaxID=271431 RepID=UPI0003F74987|nr:hypothetical protein [Arthrobacter castelli]
MPTSGADHLADDHHGQYPEPPPEAFAERPFSVMLWALRVVSSILMLLLVAQALLAALFVEGNVSMLTMHGINAFFITVVIFACFVLGIFFATVSRGAWWPMVAGVLLWLGLFVQEIIGYTRVVGLHIFAGVLLISVCSIYCYALWRHVYRPRPRRRERFREQPVRPAVDQPGRQP